MPQLDTATYLGQVTWFTFVFVTFYLVIVSYALPQINQMIKVRMKKVERTRGDATQYDAERAQTETAYNASMGGAALSALGLLTQSVETQNNWGVRTVHTLRNQEGRARSNQHYVRTLMDSEARKQRYRTMMTTPSTSGKSKTVKPVEEVKEVQVDPKTKGAVKAPKAKGKTKDTKDAKPKSAGKSRKS